MSWSEQGRLLAYTRHLGSNMSRTVVSTALLAYTLCRSAVHRCGRNVVVGGSGVQGHACAAGGWVSAAECRAAEESNICNMYDTTIICVHASVRE